MISVEIVTNYSSINRKEFSDIDSLIDYINNDLKNNKKINDFEISIFFNFNTKEKTSKQFDLSTNAFRNIPKTILSRMIFTFFNSVVDFGDNGNLPAGMYFCENSILRADWSDVSKDFKNSIIDIDKSSMDIYLGNVLDDFNFYVENSDIGNGIKCKDISKIDMNGNFANMILQNNSTIGVKDTDLISPILASFSETIVLSNKFYPLGGIKNIPSGNGIVYLGKYNRINEDLMTIKKENLSESSDITIGIPNDDNEYVIHVTNNKYNIYNENENPINVVCSDINLSITQKNENKKITKMNIIKDNKMINKSQIYFFTEDSNYSVFNIIKVDNDLIYYCSDKNQNTTEYLVGINELLTMINNKDKTIINTIYELCEMFLNKTNNNIHTVKTLLNKNEKYQKLYNLFKIMSYA